MSDLPKWDVRRTTGKTGALMKRDEWGDFHDVGSFHYVSAAREVANVMNEWEARHAE